MKKILIIIIQTFILVSCITHNPKESFTLNGTIKGEIPEFLFLQYGNVKDSVLVENGQFHFEGKVNVPTPAYFSILGNSVMTKDFFFIENSNMQMNVNLEKKSMKGYDINFISIDSISGSKTELIRTDFEVYESAHNKDADWNSKLFKKLDIIITNNPNNNYSTYVFIEQLRKQHLNKNQVEKLYHKIDSNALSIIQLEELNRIINPSQTLEVGKQLMDFELPNSIDKITSTKDFRGKILLIDFWASWCAPCRKQNPELLEIYKEYKELDFEILGVSLDTDFKKWNEAVVKDKLIWNNVIDNQAFNGKIAAKYNISAIPTNFLIDKNGFILQRNISIDELKLFLKDFQ